MVFVFFITLLNVGSLININIFGPPTLFAYFSYTIIGALIATIVGIGFFKNKQAIHIIHPLPIFVFGLLAIYYLINGLINTQGGINLRHYILFVDALLLFSYSILLSNGKISLMTFSKIIVFISAIESILCILQQLGVIPSMDSLFQVTGSNVNPNVTAMFLAMAIPAILLVLFDSPSNPIRALSPYRVIGITSFILCLVALILLQCRTAYIGATISVILIVNHQFQILSKLITKFSKAVLIIIGIISITLIIIAFLFLYHNKQASSDGRLFIWKISLQAIADKPIWGSGYGQFEHDYNLAQARYFAKKTASQQEIYSAAYVHMSYNEFLENLFEGGVVGVVLFVGLLATLLLTIQKDENNTSFYAFAGIVTFTIMCLFNFTVQALPLRALFIIYAGVCCVERKSILHLDLATFTKLPNLANANIFNKTPFRVGVTVFSLFLFFKLLTLSKAYSQCNTILETQNDLGSKEALQEMSSLKDDLIHSTYYLHGYANLLFRSKYYGAAIEKYNQALNYSSDPSIYMELGNCQSKKGRLTEAVMDYCIAAKIEPHFFAPRYGLMRLYGYKKDTTNEKIIAQEIIVMIPKKESKKVDYYKTEARKVISY